MWDSQIYGLQCITDVIAGHRIYKKQELLLDVTA